MQDPFSNNCVKLLKPFAIKCKLQLIILPEVELRRKSDKNVCCSMFIDSAEKTIGWFNNLTFRHHDITFDIYNADIYGNSFLLIGFKWVFRVGIYAKMNKYRGIVKAESL